MANKRDGIPCIEKAGETEEIFAVREQDETSGPTVLHWIELNWSNKDMSNEKLEEAFQCAMRMRNSPISRPAD